LSLPHYKHSCYGVSLFEFEMVRHSKTNEHDEIINLSSSLVLILKV